MALLIDADTILSGIEQWLQLEQKWGTPVDLDDSTLEDTAEDNPTMKTAFSSLDLKKSTFDSSYVFKTSKQRGRYSSQKSVDYKDFLQDLETSRKLRKPFFYVSGELLSAASVEEICEDIDDMFHSIEKLCSATSTIKFIPVKRKPSIHEVVQCSISTSGLSFDDTVLEPNGIQAEDDVNRYIDEVFDHLHSTLATLSNATLDQSTKQTVTSLVRKFTSILKKPALKKNPGLRRQCGDKFRDLAAFWQGQEVNAD